MGFIQGESGKFTPMRPKTVLKILEEYAAGAFCGTSRNMFETVNTLETRNDEEALWPVSFTVTAEAREMTSAFHEVCLLVAMELKVSRSLFILLIRKFSHDSSRILLDTDKNFVFLFEFYSTIFIQL